MYETELIQDHDFTLKMLSVNGSDLKQLGFTNGKEIGACLNHLLSQVIDCELENQKEILLAEAERLHKKVD